MDIDIDFRSDFNPRTVFDQAIPASMMRGDELVKHPCGHYFQTMPVDAITGLAAIPYEEAECMGFFKIDFLHLSTLDYFKNKQQIRDLISHEPDWSLLLDEKHVQKLFQISKHPELMATIKPQSVQELADAIALIRPGKKQLLGAYLRNREAVRKELYARPLPKGCYKKAHAISYALTIVLQLHLIELGKL